MFLLRETPSQDCLDRLVARYPQIEPDAVLAIMCFMRTGADVSECFERFLTKHGLSHGRFAILMYLNREPEVAVNQTHLAEAYGVTKATVTGLIDGLEREGMVERLADPADRRASLVRLTTGSRKFLDEFLPAHFRGISELMAGLDARDRTDLTRLAGKIREGIARLISNGTGGCDCLSPSSTPSDRSSRPA
ncbi:MAG TPA: MarR family transcriptional regulator [Opitutaceae bacterium]|nr:MarR family transcriptional regulator [Opitutaceae bacterium]